MCICLIKYVCSTTKVSYNFFNARNRNILRGVLQDAKFLSSVSHGWVPLEQSSSQVICIFLSI